MSLGLEVSQSTMNGNPGPAPLKPTRGQDSMGELFSSVMAAVMGPSVQPREHAVTEAEEEEAEVLESPHRGASSDLTLVQARGVTLGGINLQAAESALVAGTQGQAPSTLSPAAAQPHASALSTGVLSSLHPVADSSGALASIGSKASAEPNILGLQDGFANVLAGSILGGRSDAVGESLAGTSVLAQGIADAGESGGTPQVSDEGRQSKAPAILLEGASNKGAEMPLVTTEGVTGEASVSLPDAMAPGEDVVPKTSVDAGAGSLLGPGETFRLSQRIATEDPGAAAETTEPSTDKVKTGVLEGFEAASGKVRMIGEQRSNEAKAENGERQLDGPDVPEQYGVNLNEALGLGAGEYVTFERELTSISPAQADGAVADGRIGPDSTAISLEDARAVADRLREEALKRLPRSIEFRLDPPELGKVTVLLTTRGQDVAVKFMAANREAERALSEASGDLAQALSERGLSLAGFSVDQGERDNASQARSRETQAISWSRATRARGEAAHAIGAVPVTSTYGSRAFDYFV